MPWITHLNFVLLIWKKTGFALETRTFFLNSYMSVDTSIVTTEAATDYPPASHLPRTQRLPCEPSPLTSSSLPSTSSPTAEWRHGRTDGEEGRIFTEGVETWGGGSDDLPIPPHTHTTSWWVACRWLIAQHHGTPSWPVHLAWHKTGSRPAEVNTEKLLYLPADYWRRERNQQTSGGVEMLLAPWADLLSPPPSHDVTFGDVGICQVSQSTEYSSSLHLSLSLFKFLCLSCSIARSNKEEDEGETWDV